MERYIIKLHITEDNQRFFSYLAVNKGSIDRWGDPIGFSEYFTKEQAEKVAAQYSAWWRENIKRKTLEAVSILSLDEAVEDFHKWMIKKAADKHTASDSIIKIIERDYPAREVTEIDIII